VDGLIILTGNASFSVADTGTWTDDPAARAPGFVFGRFAAAAADPPVEEDSGV